MAKSSRNTALVFIAAGLYLLVGKFVGFFTISAILLIWFGVHTLRSGQNRAGYIVIAVGGIILITSHLELIIAIVLISLGYFWINSRKTHRAANYVQQQHLLLSMKWNQEPWALKETSLWFFIGELHLDLSFALPDEKETIFIVQGIIGDVELIVPDDWAVSVAASVLFGKIKLDREKETGLGNKMEWQSPQYAASERKVKFIISCLVGDVDIKVL